MYASMKNCLSAYMAFKTGVRIAQGIYLDASNGKIDGCVGLFFTYGGKCPHIVAKAARTHEGKAVYGVEFENLLKIEKTGMNLEKRRTPEPLGLWYEEGTLVTLQSGLSGTLMKNVPGKLLFSPERADKIISAVTAWWRLLQESFGVKQVYLSEKAYGRHIKSPVALFLERFYVDKDETRFLTQRYLEKPFLVGKTLPFMVRHGDFCTANMIFEPSGVGVIDWEYPLRHELPLFDLFFFFSSLRFPYSGYRGESNHFRSFTEVFWGNAYINGAMRRSIREICALFQIHERIVPDLFLLSLIQIAHMKYDAFFKSLGIHESPGTDTSPWGHKKISGRAMLKRLEKNVPFSYIRKGVCETVRFAIRNGLPEFT